MLQSVYKINMVLKMDSVLVSRCNTILRYVIWICKSDSYMLLGFYRRLNKSNYYHIHKCRALLVGFPPIDVACRAGHLNVVM